MIRPTRFGTAVSTLAIAVALAGCAASTQKSGSPFGLKVDKGDLGLATRAQAELARGQVQAAVELAERAVESTPNDAGFRSLLGNCYFAAGRFASAEQAYSDSLSLLPAQPQIILKLALVQIAQGKDGQALAALELARPALDPADYGLAVALAGRPDEAVAVLDQAARLRVSDARVRQNLALAYGLSGDWTMARTIAAQDVPPDQLDARIEQWMAMATPSRPSDQLAALTGVQPAADPGQPQRLALKGSPDGERYAQLDVPASDAQPQPAAQAEIPAVAPPALPDPAPAVATAAAPEPVIATLIQPDSQPAAPVAAAAAPEPAQAPTEFAAPVEPAQHVAISNTVRKAAAQKRRSNGRSNSVVQLGAYSSPDRVSSAWNAITKRYPALAEYTPMRARFDGPKGTVWRLSIKGFASDGEARDRCELLQSRGGSCFVRRVAGDAPVQFASR